jgi:hypothetical protein
METILTETAKQVPNLAILGFIVWIFLSHLAKRDKDFNDNVKFIHDEHIANRNAAQVIIKENTDSNRAVIKAVSELSNKCALVNKN